jgi:hypothetical protein
MCDVVRRHFGGSIVRYHRFLIWFWFLLRIFDRSSKVFTVVAWDYCVLCRLPLYRKDLPPPSRRKRKHNASGLMSGRASEASLEAVEDSDAVRLCACSSLFRLQYIYCISVHLLGFRCSGWSLVVDIRFSKSLFLRPPVHVVSFVRDTVGVAAPRRSSPALR